MVLSYSQLVVNIVRMHVDKTSAVYVFQRRLSTRIKYVFAISLFLRAWRKPLFIEGSDCTILMYLTRQKYSIRARIQPTVRSMRTQSMDRKILRSMRKVARRDIINDRR